MHTEIIIHLHVSLLFSAFCFTLTLLPEASKGLVLPFVRIALAFRRLKEALRSWSLKERARRFREIDMTGFEP